MITNAEIRDLQVEAGSAGDTEQVDLCTAALEGNEVARAECERVILEAREMMAWEQAREQEL